MKSEDLNSYELKSFRIQHDETQIVKYLVKFAKKHQKQLLNKTFLVRESGSDNLVVFSINTPKLIDYYTNRLGFKEIENLDDKLFFEYAVPDYDDACKFLYFPLS